MTLIWHKTGMREYSARESKDGPVLYTATNVDGQREWVLRFFGLPGGVADAGTVTGRAGRLQKLKDDAGAHWSSLKNTADVQAAFNFEEQYQAIWNRHLHAAKISATSLREAAESAHAALTRGIVPAASLIHRAAKFEEACTALDTLAELKKSMTVEGAGSGEDVHETAGPARPPLPRWHQRDRRISYRGRQPRG